MAVTQTRPDGKTMPNQSLYIQNLPEKLQKGDLRRSLYMLFSSYGPVLDITALKTSKMRGQAHVLFRDVQSATQAMNQCQEFEFFGRPMVSARAVKLNIMRTHADQCYVKRISYAKNKSDTLARLTGTYKQPDLQPQQEATAGSSLQQSVFAAPPGSKPPGAPPPGLQGAQQLSGLPPPPTGPPKGLPPGLPQKVVNGDAKGPEDVASPQGEKRKRDEESEEEEEEEDGDAAMEEDDEGEMEMDSDDD